MQDVHLVTMNGDLIRTFKREELEGVPVEFFTVKLERNCFSWVPPAKCDDLDVPLERFSLVIRNEVMERNDSRFVTDYFADGEGPIRITLVKQPVEEAEYNKARREAELEIERWWSD